MRKTIKDDSYSHILKYTGLFGGVQGFNILVGLVRNKLVAMILGPEGMGLISLFNSTVKFLSDSTNLGIGMTAVREISEAYECEDAKRLQHHVRMVRGWSFLTALVGAFLCVIISPLLNKWTFTWGDHTLHFILLSPMVAMLAITSGELAILKGTRQLRHLAVLSVYGVLAALLVSTPLYLIWGEAAIVPSLVLVTGAQLLFAVMYSYRLFPLHLSFNKSIFYDGMGMVRLGVAFLLAGILGSGAEFLIRTYLNHVGDLQAVGLYNAGYLITMTYAGMVFQAMETDYFPRLSAVCGDSAASISQVNDVINRQIEVSILLIAPLLTGFVVCVSWMLPLLFSSKFMPVLEMMRVAILAMYMRAITLPIEYLSLAKGASRSYLCLELFYDVLIVTLVILGYHRWGLTGTGVALLVAGILNLLVVLAYMRWRFQYLLSRRVLGYMSLQIPIGLSAYILAQRGEGMFFWIFGVLLILLSALVSVYILRSQSHLWSSLTLKMRRKIGKR